LAGAEAEPVFVGVGDAVSVADGGGVDGGVDAGAEVVDGVADVVVGEADELVVDGVTEELLVVGLGDGVWLVGGGNCFTGWPVSAASM
jgi:hypothetical protein